MKKIAKILNTLFNDEKFITECLKYSNYNIKDFQMAFGQIMTYYIKTRDTKLHSFETFGEILKHRLYAPLNNVVPLNMKKNETFEEAIERNVVTNGFMTHSFNGCNKKRHQKYGLGSEKCYDSVLAQKLRKLEEDLGVNNYLKDQPQTSSAIYYAAPSGTSIYYAMQQSPERLFHGPLRQGSNPMPVIVGESRESYYMRVVIDKVNKLYSIDERDAVIANARDVIHEFCGYKPCIALFPINSKKYTLNASFAKVEQDIPPTLQDYIQNRAKYYSSICPENTEFGFINDFFNRAHLGGWSGSELDDLVSVGTHIPPSEIEFVDVLSTFDLSQKIALAKGMKKGDFFHLYTGEKIKDMDAFLYGERNLEDFEKQVRQENTQALKQKTKNLSNSKVSANPSKTEEWDLSI